MINSVLGFLNDGVTSIMLCLHIFYGSAVFEYTKLNSISHKFLTFHDCLSTSVASS